MASLKDTRKRIAVVQNTQKITKAMKLVSSSKYVKANQAASQAQAYGQGLGACLGALPSQLLELEQPLWSPGNSQAPRLLVVLSPKGGLCGGLGAALWKKAQELGSGGALGEDTVYILWGKSPLKEEKGGAVWDCGEKPPLAKGASWCAQQLASLRALFLEGKVRSVHLLYGGYKNALSQEPSWETLLPLAKPSSPVQGFSPHLEEKGELFLEGLLDRVLEERLRAILLESELAEHAARMTAMDCATKNADQVIKDLTLELNRERQRAITTELIEITSGAQAL